MSAQEKSTQWDIVTKRAAINMRVYEMNTTQENNVQLLNEEFRTNAKMTMPRIKIEMPKIDLSFPEGIKLIII